MATASSYRLTDRFVADEGTVFLSGTQALARIPVEQLRADRRAGLRTAAFVSGYPGSPLGGFDGAIASAARVATDVEIVHRPAVNEEYGVTAVMGSQLALGQPDARYDGVVGLWYGKAPGVDRATDALRHAVYAGTAPNGGAVALVGDDPLAKSSTLPSSSAGVLADLYIPFLYPGDPAEALDLGRHAVVLSRVTGLWTALKIVADVADGTASVELDPDRVRPIIPSAAQVLASRKPDGALLTPHTLDLEREIEEVRYPLAIQYALENELNGITVGRSDAWIAIIASGITYIEVKEALARLGFRDDDAIADAGIRLIQMRMPLPFDPGRMREITRGVTEILVVEEKHPHIESLVKDALYSQSDRPVIVGKHDEADRTLVPGWSALDADAITPVLRSRLGARLGDRLAPPPPPRRERIPVNVARSPFFCSGCPHNRSTQVPDGSLVGAGIGCHTMTMLMDPARVGDIAGITCMGNEGTQWIGMEPFIERDHLLQNLGDGTYFHSGQLAITAAIAAGSNITYKLLYNGAVAMTGGQDPQGQLGVAQVVRILLEQGVAEVLVTTDDVARVRALDLPRGVKVWDRARLEEAQRHLATVEGVTVLLHDQACAAEARRARKRGLIETPDQRVVINQRVCEGCGDCGQVSNCLSVQPVETAFGRKTRIDQSTCNLDFSCLEGDCPSFMTVSTDPGWIRRLRHRFRGSSTPPAPAAPAGAPRSALDGLPEPSEPTPAVPTDELAIRLTGVGGTGVVTVAQIIGTAAMLTGYSVRGLDQIGLSQKAGPVVSDLTLSRSRSDHSSRLGARQADVLIALDQLVGASAKGLDVADEDRTIVIGSTTGAPTGEMITHPDIAMPAPDELAERLAEVSRPGHQHWADAAAITQAVFGDSITANLFVVGMTYQAGALPVPAEVIHEAIELNGVAVDANQAAFELGRRYVVDRDAVLGVVEDALDERPVLDLAASLATRIDELADDPARRDRLAMFTAELVAFQDEDLAQRYLALVGDVAGVEAGVRPGSTALTDAVAANFYKLLAYKDEYEVARLLLDEASLAEAAAVAGGGRISYRLHPPLLRALGLRRKIALGAWSRPLLRLLARGKAVRGRWYDPFGRAEVRRIERELPEEYEGAIRRVLARVDDASLDEAVRLASLPDQVRGYEHLKLERAATYRAELAQALTAFA